MMVRLAFAMAALYSAAVLAFTRQWQAWASLMWANLLVFGSLTASVGALLLIGEMIRHRGDGPGEPRALTRVLQRYREGERCARVLVIAVVSAALTLSSYNIFKQFVLPGTGYWLGKSIANVDWMLLGGHDAWRVTHALLPYAWQTGVLDLFYHGWFLPMGVGVVLCGFARVWCDIAGRYMASYVATWIVQGTVLAWFFPAAGPCFVSSIKHADRFKPLTDLLAAQNRTLEQASGRGLTALDYQQALLYLYHNKQATLGGGIAAMPSLHNALAMLFACAAWQFNRTFGVIFSVFAVLIWIGSVHLGWHYAVDGIVGSSIAFLTWHAFGWLQVRLVRPRADPQPAVPAGLTPVPLLR